MATENTAAAVASQCVNDHGGAIGMPQLCGEWIPNQIFWLLVTLVAIYLLLTRIALPRISAVLADGSRKDFPKLTEREVIDAAGGPPGMRSERGPA